MYCRSGVAVTLRIRRSLGSVGDTVAKGNTKTPSNKRRGIVVFLLSVSSIMVMTGFPIFRHELGPDEVYIEACPLEDWIPSESRPTLLRAATGNGQVPGKGFDMNMLMR